MRVFRAVALDLYYFAGERLREASKRLLPGRALVRRLPALPPPLSLTAPAVSSTRTIIDHQTATEPFVQTSSLPWFTVGEHQVSVHTVPAKAFDSVLMTLPFGSRVQVHRFAGRWAQVTSGPLSGWVLKDTLYEHTDTLFPTFVPGESYRADAPATRLLRQCINDQFAGAQSGSDLCSAEYVTYRLWLTDRQINWGINRPRVAGVWQQLLRGVGGVHSGITPKTGSVMEYLTVTGGQLAYVESVSKDETITISLITEDESAVYLEQTLVRSAWIELRPVFIEVL